MTHHQEDHLQPRRWLGSEIGLIFWFFWLPSAHNLFRENANEIASEICREVASRPLSEIASEIANEIPVRFVSL